MHNNQKTERTRTIKDEDDDDVGSGSIDNDTGVCELLSNVGVIVHCV